MSGEPSSSAKPSISSRPHAVDARALLVSLGVDPARGLDAARIESLRAQFGPNRLPETQRRPAWRVVLAQFQSPLIYLLLVAAVLAAALGKREDASVILAVVLLNALIGALQEGRAERSMESLKRLAALRVRVVRESHERTIEAVDLVPGDILLLAAGDAVGADARLIEAAALEAAEAALTGESLPVVKHLDVLPEDTLLADRRNMLYSGTHLTAGRARALVVATGIATEVGKVARLTSAAVEPKTPLELRLSQFGRALVGCALGLFVAIMAFGAYRGVPTADVFMIAISQMVSLVPEGLPVAMTIALAVGMQRMAARGAIVRRLSAVETLGSTSIICSDKTGTLTKNEMTVTHLWIPPDSNWIVTGEGYAPVGEIRPATPATPSASQSEWIRLLECAALCNDSQLVPPDVTDTRWRCLGDPTEAALLTLALKGCIPLDSLRHQWPRRAELPFDSSTKLMATQHGHSGTTQRTFLKGAPEVLLDLCGFSHANGCLQPLDPTQRSLAIKASEAMGHQALRVLAVGEVPGEINEAAGFEQFRGRVVLLGLIGQLDPPRSEVHGAVAECLQAGIRPVMVTGDHKATGLAIARSLGIAREDQRAVDGHELEAMPEQELRSQLDRIAVFARVHPAQKLRIVEAFQSQGHVVAMTGDGVNDAPALARADVGVAMGLTGTEVAKGAARIVITDDNFTTIVRAIEQGRLVYANLQKLLLFLFATSIDEVIILMAALLFGYPLPLAAVQILWINLVTEGTLTLNLVMEQAEGDEMDSPPIPANQPLITRTMMRRMALMVPTSVLATFGFFVWRLSTGLPFELVQTETFTVLAVCQWFNALNCESESRSALSLGVLRNRWLLGGLIVANVLHILVIYTEPMNRLFHTVPIPLPDFFLIGAVASSVLWVEEARKFIARRTRSTVSQPAS